MGQTTAISWCDHTFNPWWGCTFVGGSPACAPAEGKDGAVCYAYSWDKRLGGNHWGADAPRRFFGADHWKEPLRWNAAAKKAGFRRRVFCMSMGDWAEGRPDQEEALISLYDLILQAPHLDWLMLTKRPQLINSLSPWPRWPRHVWQGITTETQAWLDLRWEHLKRVEASIYWLSIEPLFERIVLPADFLVLGKRAWVVVGGQSGTHAVPMAPEWARSLRDQCMAAGVPFHFKQYGEWAPQGPGAELFPVVNFRNVAVGDGTSHRMFKVGKKAAGHLLDGQEWLQFPEPRA